MRIKTIFFLIFCLIFQVNSWALNIDSIKLVLNNYQQDDKLEDWLDSYLAIEYFFYSQDKTIEAESVLDTIISSAWRNPETTSENDLFFKLHWYKAFYAKDNGQIVKAKNHFEKSLKYYANSSKNQQEDLLIIYPPLGNIYTILGENEKAILAHQKMIEIANSLADYKGKNDDLAVAYTNLAITYETLGNIDLAINTIEKASKLQSISSYNSGMAYSNLGDFLYQKNKLDLAAQKLKIAKNLLQKSDSYALGGIYKTMAFISIEKKNFQLANHFFDLAIENYKKSPIVRNREIAKSYLEKSKISSDKVALLNIALQYLIPHRNDFPKSYFPEKTALFAENTLADIFYEETQLPLEPNTILACYAAYFEVQKLIRQEYLFKNSKKLNLQQDRKVIDEAIAFCYFMYEKNQEEKYAVKALEFIENEKAILLYESLATEINQQANEDYFLYTSTKKSLINELVAAKLNEDKIKSDSLNQLIKKLDFENEINSKKVSKDEFAIKQFNFKKFKKHFLQENESFIAFYDALELFSIVLQSNNIKFYKITKDKEFVDAINEFKSSFNFENRFNFNQQNAQKIGEQFVQIIPENTKKIYLATDGILNNIPFEAFKNKEEYFIEKYEFQYVFSGNILQNINYNKVNNQQLLAIAPVFKNNVKKQLLKSEEEVNNTLKIIKGNSLLNENANTTNFIKQAKEYAILHISSHAQIDQKLDAASIDFFDKSLYFSQIEHEQFETDLLVLSACETGIGKQEAGEGTLSLSKAFAYSKIPSIISSLWKVNEESSLVIFNSFYENIKAKKSISTALRNAKLDYLHHPKIADEKKQPYYWASFILLGEDNVLEIETTANSAIYFYLLLAILCLISMWLTYKIVKNHFNEL